MAEPATVSTLYPALPSLFLKDREETDLAQGILTLMVEEDVAGLYHCELTLTNWGSTGGEVGLLHATRDRLDFGKPLAVEVGSGKTADRIFEGRITALEGRFPKGRAPEITVLAEDRFQDLRMTRRSRTFENVEDTALFNEIATDHGLTAEIDVQGAQHVIIAQLNQSDLAFLRERARALDAELWMEGKTLYVQDRKKRTAKPIELTYGKRLQELSVVADLAEQCSSLTVTGWDVSAKSEIVEEAGPSILGAELGALDGGSAILDASLGPRPQTAVHFGPPTATEARSLAQAHYRMMARRFVTGEAVCEGDARLRAGTTVELSGVGPMFEGKYYVAGVRHVFDPIHGLRSIIAVERAGIGGGT